MKTIVTIFFVITFIETNAQIAINEDGSKPNPSAILDLKSKDKGLLLPRVADPNNDIAKPSSGLMVYNAAEKNLNFFNGNNWNGLASKADIKPESDFYSIFPNSKGFLAPFNEDNIDFTIYTWVVPASTTKIWIEAWAGGQAGFDIKDSYSPQEFLPVGGSAGSFGSFIAPVSPNETIIIKVGKGGLRGENDALGYWAGDTVIETIGGKYTVKKTSANPNTINLPSPLIISGLIQYIEGESGQNCSFLTNGTMIAGKGGTAHPKQIGGLGVDETYTKYSTGGAVVTYIKSSTFNARAQNGQMPGGGGGAGVTPGKGGPGMVILHW